MGKATALRRGGAYGRVTVRLHGVHLAARTLAVDPTHLRLVVRGVRRSDRLLAAVRERFPDMLAAGGRTWNEALGLPTWRDEAAARERAAAR